MPTINQIFLDETKEILTMVDGDLTYHLTCDYALHQIQLQIIYQESKCIKRVIEQLIVENVSQDTLSATPTLKMTLALLTFLTKIEEIKEGK